MSELQENKPWMVFRLDLECKKGDDCQCCGYFYGSAHPRNGEKVKCSGLKTKLEKE